MARSYNGSTTSDYRTDALGLTGFPIVFSCWFQAANVTASHTLMALSEAAANDSYLIMYAGGSVAGDPIIAQHREGTVVFASTTSGYSAATWHHAACMFAATDLRAAWLDGGSKGTETTARNFPVGMNRTSLGVFISNSTTSLYLNGQIQEAGVWDGTNFPGATAADKLAWFEATMLPGLAKGWTPDTFPLGLRAHYGLGGLYPKYTAADGTIPDLRGGYPLTPANLAWADHAGPLIYPSAALWLPGEEAGATALTVQDSECVVESDTVSLTQHFVLTVADSECVVESEGPSLTQHFALAVADSECVVESESPALTQHQALAVADSECLVESEQPALTQHFALTVQDSECVVESEQPALTQHQSLAVNDSECLVESDTVTLTVAWQLAVQDSECVVESDLVALTQHHVLTVADSECLVTSEEPTLTAHDPLSQLVVQNSECVVESESPSLTQHHVLTVANSECVVESDNVLLVRTWQLIVADSECVVESESPSLTQYARRLQPAADSHLRRAPASADSQLRRSPGGSDDLLRRW